MIQMTHLSTTWFLTFKIAAGEISHGFTASHSREEQTAARPSSALVQVDGVGGSIGPFGVRFLKLS